MPGEAERFWITTMDSDAVRAGGTPEFYAVGVAQDNADNSAQEQGFAEYSEQWYEFFRNSYLEALPRCQAEFED